MPVNSEMKSLFTLWMCLIVLFGSMFIFSAHQYWCRLRGWLLTIKSKPIRGSVIELTQNCCGSNMGHFFLLILYRNVNYSSNIHNGYEHAFAQCQLKKIFFFLSEAVCIESRLKKKVKLSEFCVYLPHTCCQSLKSPVSVISTKRQLVP